MTQTTPDLTGRVCLVTGASSGIGKEAAVELARMGATVFAVSRDPARGHAAYDEIRKRSGSDRVQLWLGDLMLQRENHRLAADFRKVHKRLDVLLLNAGSNFGQWRLTDEGVERTFALNHVGPFLLTQLLLDPLKASAPSRIVLVSSEAHRQGKIHLPDPSARHVFGVYGAYAQSKLANLLTAKELSRQLQGTGVTANALHPGVVATNIWSAGSFSARVIGWLARPFMVDAATGAETLVHLASAPEVASVSGAYFIRKLPVVPSKRSSDPDLARQLWDATHAMLKPPPELPRGR
jgi:NAD(P)-dependent dehydrogenase (short-subunit alcohol dehydrogenase family)